MICLVSVGMISIASVVIVGLLKGHDGVLIGSSLTVLGGIVGSVITYYRTKAKLTRGMRQ